VSARRNQVEIGVWRWLAEHGAQGGIPGADSPSAPAVVFADQDAPRALVPHLVIRVDGYDGIERDDEGVTGINPDDPTGDGQWRSRGQRTATAAVQAFGDGADAWVERAVAKLGSPAVRRLLEDVEIEITPISDLLNLSGLLDESTMPRWSRDFRVDYERSTAPDEVEAVREVRQIVHTGEWAGSPNTRTVVVTEDVP
jgi:hypothetical protein